jgi:hypothetical protein
MSELPEEIQKPNIVLATEDGMLTSHRGLVTVEDVRRLNAEGAIPSFKRKDPDLPPDKCINLSDDKGNVNISR